MTTNAASPIFGPPTTLDASMVVNDRLIRMNRELCRSMNRARMKASRLEQRLDEAKARVATLTWADSNSAAALRDLRSQVRRLQADLTTEREEFESVLLVTAERAEALEAESRALKEATAATAGVP
jgi:chromosome segregation ATPase